MSDVPIVGQAAKVLHWYPTLIVNCQCGGPNMLTLLIVTGFNNHVACPKCGKLYSNNGMKQNPVTGAMDVDLGCTIVPKTSVQ